MRPFKCVTDQVVRIKGEPDFIFYDRHCSPIYCLTDPCQARLHAVQNLFAKCASEGFPLIGQSVILKRIPCFSCVRLLSASQLREVILLEEPATAESWEAFDLLAVNTQISSDVPGPLGGKSDSRPSASATRKKPGRRPSKRAKSA